MTRLVTRSKAGSPGFGVSWTSPRAPASSRARTASGTRYPTPRRWSTASASAKVVGSGAVRPRGSHAVDDRLGGGLAPRVGHGMAGLLHDDALREHRIAVLHDDQSLGDPPAEGSLHRRRHRAAGLAAAEHEQVAPGRTRQLDAEALEGAIDERGDIAGGERRPPDGLRSLAGRIRRR